MKPAHSLWLPDIRGAARLVRDSSGVALIEFAFSLPILIIIMAFGLELANYVLTTKRIGDIAVLVADNASRMGRRNAGLSVHQISEAEINDLFIGARLQADIGDYTENGRIILSSLQRNNDGGQWIAWQRCFGENGLGSAYGVEGDGATGTGFPGMGPPSNRVQAPSGTAVMVVEVYYNYQPIVPIVSIPPRTIRELAVFNVRESRDLGAPRNAEGVEVSFCEE
jgi:TadE-like protein